MTTNNTDPAAPFSVAAVEAPHLDDPTRRRTLYRVFFQGRPVGWQRSDDVAKLNADYAARVAKKARAA